MRLVFFFLIFMSCTNFVWAQASNAELLAAPILAIAGGIEQRTERFIHEDSDLRIDELRLGGETKTINVTPKGGLPTYQIQPTTGVRSWKILDF